MNIIPKPHKLAETGGKLKMNPYIVLDSTCSSEDLFSAKQLKQELLRSVGICHGITKSNDTIRGGIVLRNKQKEGEGYTLDVTAEGVFICGDSSKGLFYGVQTMRQMIRQYLLQIPCVKIEDAPSIEVRGLYFDITRGRIPKLEHMFEIIDRLAFYKQNHMQFYIEHCFPFKGFSEVYTGKGLITPEEILEIDEYAYKRHIELVPSIATFGHLYEVLQTKSFQKYCELENYVPTGHRWNERQQHHIIDISRQEAHEFIKSLIDQYYPLFRSKTFNICFDETFDLATGKSQALGEKIGKDRLYVDYLNELSLYLKSKGIKTMFWGNIICKKEPVQKSVVLKDMIMGIGDYDDIPNEELIACGNRIGLTTYLLSGTQSWSQIYNAYDIAFKNITAMAVLAKKYKSKGLLTSVWGDEGHSCHFENSFPLVALNANVAWNYDQSIDKNDFFEALAKIEYGDSSGELVKIIFDLSEAQAKYNWAGRMPISFLWFYFIHLIFAIEKNNHARFCEKWLDETAIKELEKADEKVQNLKNKLLSILPVVPIDRRPHIEVFLNSAESIRVISNAILVLMHYPETPSPAAAEELENWLEDYSRVWRRDNKESELSEIINIVQKAGVFMRTEK